MNFLQERQTLYFATVLLPFRSTGCLKITSVVQIWKLKKIGTHKDTVVDQNKIGQSVTLDSFTIQRFV
jgi:hypothetical protein